MAVVSPSATTRTYALGRGRLVLRFQDIVRSDAEVLVSSDDYMLSMGGGVSAAIASAAGDSLRLDAAKSRPRSLGDVVVTTAGALPARYVFHGVTIGQVGQRRPPGEVVRQISERCLNLAEDLGVSSIAFPALGTGAAGFGMQDSAAAMAETVTDVLASPGEPLTVVICLHAREFTAELDYIHFFEEFARRAPQVARHEMAPGERGTAVLPQGRAGTTGAAQRRVLDLVALERRRNELEVEIERAGRHHDDSAVRRLHAEYVRNLEERIQVGSHDPARKARPYRLFLSYAHEDERWLHELSKHLSGLRHAEVIESWHDRLISPGSDWDREVDDRLRDADLYVFLVSADFLASDYIRSRELALALERHDAGEALAVPVLLRPVDWADTPLSRLQALPRDAVPVSQWPDTDGALVDVVRGIRELTVRLRELSQSA